MKESSASIRFLVSRYTLMKFFDDKVALAHIGTKRFHLLNATAAMIWKQICAGQTRAEIEKLICNKFEVSSEDVSSQIDHMLTLLKSEGFILQEQ
jgi:coenzyme PQQ synthesis protein D (PqqD)